jgi:hypothetical protein
VTPQTEQTGRIDMEQQLAALARSYRTADQAADLERLFAEIDAPEAETI